MNSLVLATPHQRYDWLEAALIESMPAHKVVRIRTREELCQDRLKHIAPEYIFFPHWSWHIPAKIYNAFECVIFHMTDLPYGRGGSPLQNLIVRGHRETSLTSLRCESKLDAGPIYNKTPLSLSGSAEEILRRAAVQMHDMIVSIVNKRLKPLPQEGEVVEFKRRRPEDGNLDHLTELGKVYDYIRMLDAEGYPSAFLQVGNLRLEFSSASLDDDQVHAKVRITKCYED